MYFFNKKNKMVLLISTTILYILVFYQNCSNPKIAIKETASSSQFSGLVDCIKDPTNKDCSPIPAKCYLGEHEVLNGDSVTTFLSSSVEEEDTCQKEDRICDNGILSGSYRYSSCNVRIKKSCLFNGIEIKSGDSVKAFSESTVGFGNLCPSEDRTCNDGVLSGSASFANCLVGEAMSCFFNGVQVNHLETVIANKDSSVAFGSLCEKEDRVCFNGELSGNFSFASCSVDSPKSCLFKGETLAHGEVVHTFASPINNICAEEDRICNNGNLSGSYTNTSCELVPPDSDGGSLCGQVRDVQGDMRVFVEPGATLNDNSKLEFGTFADNYWDGNVETGKEYIRSLTFNISDLSQVSKMTLVNAAFDDWLQVKVNGNIAYIGPKSGSDRLIHLANGRVQYTETATSVPELSTSWNINLNINILPYLLEGKNIIETKTIVAGHGESAIKFLYKTQCQSKTGVTP